MSGPGAPAEAFRLLQAGRAEEAFALAQRLIVADPRAARAHLAAGLALRMLGRVDASLTAIEEAARLDPRDYGAAYERGVALDLAGRGGEALACFERAAALRPDFAPAHVNLGLALAESGNALRAAEVLRDAVARFPNLAEARHALGWALHKAKRAADAIAPLQEALRERDHPRWRLDLAKALADAGRLDEARGHFEAAHAAAARDPLVLVTFGRFCVAQADFARAAQLFREAHELHPGDLELAMYLAQVELARGRWREGWSAYARREQRVLFEAESRRRGEAYTLPPPQALAGRLVVLTAEQGLGDELFFLRFAPALRALGARLAYAGDARLRSLLARTGLFDRILGAHDATPADAVRILTADLPLLLESGDTPPSLAIAPDPARVEAMRRRLERIGPRPWIGVTWRAGTPRQVVSYALYKTASIPGLFAAMPRDGTVLSLQRDGHFEELESASHAMGRPIYDLSGVNEELEDALAAVALLDRHIAVSNTNLHLAAAAGATADVLVPFPPEWRWGLAGESPWFPGFRVFRQAPGGDWSRAYAALASAPAGNTSRG